ncbi:MAG: pyridoxal phosphate-dependent aminotransferase [Vicinamibacterales bacterium]
MGVIADRLSAISESPTLKVGANAERMRRAGIDVIDLGAGEPDFNTPEHAKAAAVRAIEENFTRYTAASGVIELREAICARYRSDYGIEFKTNEVSVAAGGKQALFNVALALYNPGDEVITHAPYWPTIVEQVKMTGATPVIARTSSDDGFAVHADAILERITPRTKAIIINSPGNPTGALISESELARIADVAGPKGIWIVIDLCYEQLIYDTDPHNLPKVLFDRMRERTILCGSASKAYAMTGWRCGWTIAPAEVIAACNTILSHATSNIASITQKAAIAALVGPQDDVTRMLDEYRVRRDNMHAWLTAHPAITCVKPRGAFYLFPDLTRLLSPEMPTTGVFADRLLEEAHVALTPGEAFDAPGYVRISYATSMKNLEEASKRLLAFADRVRPSGGAR